MHRVILVEFVTPDRFHGGWGFPFARGLLEQGGAHVQWLRFGLHPAVQFRRDERGPGLEPDDLGRLRAAVEQPGVTHVIFSREPSAGVLRAIENTTGNLRAAVLDHARGDGRPRGDIEFLSLSQTGLRRWVLGESGGDGRPAGPSVDIEDNLFAFDSPDYRYEPANPVARQMDPVVYVVCGKSCNYRRSLRASPLPGYGAEAGDPGYWGCSFCVTPGVDLQKDITRQEAEQRLLRQLSRIALSHPASDRPLRYRITGARLTEDPEMLARAVLKTVPSAGDFLLDFRADQLVRRAGELKAAAALLNGSGHRLQVCLVGVESFSLPQLERYAKGYAPEVNLQAVRVLLQLEEEFPGSFAFREYGGLSTILYDPWTSFSDIAINLAVVKFFGLQDLCGKLLTSRLRLQEGTPIERAARRDGLIVDRYRDPLFDTARLNFYEQEIPWIFADQQVEQLVRLLIRLAPEIHRDGDPLCDRIRAWERRVGQKPIDSARQLLELAASLEQGRPIVDAEELLRQAMAATAADPAGASSLRPIDTFLECDPGEGAAGFREDIVIFDCGLKPVLKLEDYGDQERLRARQEELGGRWPGVCVRPRWPSPPRGRDFEIFIGRDPEKVEEAYRIAELFDNETDPGREREGILRMGELLGYPACCTRAYAEVPQPFRFRNEWLWLWRRLEAAGPVADGIHPLLSWVPCSLSCRATADIVDRARSHPQAALLRRLADLPTIVMFERPGEFIFLDPIDPPGSSFRYRVVGWRTREPRLSLLRDGDTLEVEPGLLRVKKQGRETAHFALEAFLWCKDRVFHADFWRECLHVLQKPPLSSRGDDRGGSRVRGSPEGARTADPYRELRNELREVLERVLQILSEHPERPLRGFAPTDIGEHATSAGWGELSGVLRRGRESLYFFIQDGSRVRSAFYRTENFALMYGSHTPPDSEEKKRVLRTLLQSFEKGVRRKVPLPNT